MVVKGKDRLPNAPRFFRLTRSAITLLSGSCRDARLGRLADRILGENIILPDSLELLNPQCVADTAWLSSDGKIKLIIHFPEEYCTGCRLSANNLLDSILHILPSSGFAPMVILGSPDKAAVANAEAAIAVKEPRYPIYLDPGQRLLKMNPVIPEEPLLQAFLLDTDNHVVLVGDPSFDFNIMNLYRQVLSDIKTNNFNSSTE